jgi:phosphatidylserine/phosphatidylglycerophosphate/cardiolipin synthase-like enzyme
MTSIVDIVGGQAVSQLLERVALQPARYREVLVCSPYLDDETASLIGQLAVQAPRSRCGFTLLTRAEAARRVIHVLPAPLRRWSPAIHVHHRLHAKVYLAMARAHRDSEAIVTSANLTLDGLGLNEELGVRFNGTTSEGRLALLSIKHAVQQWLH